AAARSDSKDLREKSMKMSVKVVGASGQISLGKEYAGRQVLVEEPAPGVWMVRTATVIPDNERWLHMPQVAGPLSRALTWASKNPPAETDLDALKRELGQSEQKPSRKQSGKSRRRPQQS